MERFFDLFIGLAHSGRWDRLQRVAQILETTGVSFEALPSTSGESNKRFVQQLVCPVSARLLGQLTNCFQDKKITAPSLRTILCASSPPRYLPSPANSPDLLTLLLVLLYIKSLEPDTIIPLRPAASVFLLSHQSALEARQILTTVAQHATMRLTSVWTVKGLGASDFSVSVDLGKISLISSEHFEKCK
jgi:hypothetical protein